jgi:hypothetical protein
MSAAAKREIVIEIERIRVIRKRAKTELVFCGKCGKIVDFVSLVDVSALFMTETHKIFKFLTDNGCHFYEEINGDIYICLIELLETMRFKAGNSGPRLIGDNTK